MVEYIVWSQTTNEFSSDYGSNPQANSFDSDYNAAQKEVADIQASGNSAWIETVHHDEA